MSADPETDAVAGAESPEENSPNNPVMETAITIALFVGFVLFVAICLPIYFF